MTLLSKELIDLNQSVNTKKEIFERIAVIASNYGRISSKENVVEGLFKREAQTSTGMVDGFAIPHTQSEAVDIPSIVVIKNDKEIEWETLDESNVKFVLAILIPKDSESNLHLKVLSGLSRKLMNGEFREGLLQANSSLEVLDLLEGIN